MTEDADPLLIATTQIVTAWLGSHEVATVALPELIRDVHLALAGTEPDRPAAPRMRPAVRRVQDKSRAPDQPAVDIRRSVFPDHLICLEDGKSFKTLTRHLNETHGITPEQYRAKWDLPATYPMMAPDYSKERSRLSSGGGKRR
jgi:predicted transcriptional regulator